MFSLRKSPEKEFREEVSCIVKEIEVRQLKISERQKLIRVADLSNRKLERGSFHDTFYN